MDYYFGYFLVILCFEIGFNISNDPFLKFVLLMFCIVIFHRIMSTFMDRRDDKVMYMLCIFKRTFSSGCRRCMIKLSNICPCALKSVKQKARASGNWYLLIMNILEVFDSNMGWWYWKFLDMGIIDLWHLKGGLLVVCFIILCYFLWNH
jgi:hypothetical protein